MRNAFYRHECLGHGGNEGQKGGMIIVHEENHLGILISS